MIDFIPGDRYRVDIPGDIFDKQIIEILSVDPWSARCRTEGCRCIRFSRESEFAKKLIKLEADMQDPEPRLNPPESDYITADCGCEVYEGEPVVTFNGKSMCEDCFWDLIKGMTVQEVATLLEWEYREVEFNVH